MQSIYTTREKILLGTIAGCIVLNSGFTMLRVPPIGLGIPIGECVLLLSLVTLSVFRTLGQLSSVVWVLPFVIWWMYGLARALAGVPEYGPWALRDASQVIESLFLLAGFAFALNPHKLERFFSWYYWLFFVTGAYCLSYPIREFLQALSPKIQSAAGYPVPVFFSYQNAGIVIMEGAAVLLLLPGRFSRGRTRYFWVSAYFAVAIGVIQSRTIYLELIAAFAVFMFLNRKVFSAWILVLVSGLLLIFLIPMSGIEFKGRLGKNVSIELITKHFSTLSGSSGGSSEGQDLSGAANGIGQRLSWWRHIQVELTSTPTRMAFGLGYGMPLTNFKVGQGVRVREPHNSFISVLARLGILGALIWLCMHAALFWTWLSGFRLARRRGWKLEERRMLALFMFFIFVLVSTTGEDSLEKPFIAIPYYFFWGIVLAYVSHLRRIAIVLSGVPVEQTTSPA